MGQNVGTRYTYVYVCILYTMMAYMLTTMIGGCMGGCMDGRVDGWTEGGWVDAPADGLCVEVSAHARGAIARAGAKEEWHG